MKILYVKSLRSDAFSFAKNIFFPSVIQTQSWQKTPLRPPVSSDFPYVVRGAEIVRGDERKPMYSPNEKKGYSPKTPVSMITKENYCKIFHFAGDESKQLAGVIFKKTATLPGKYNALYDEATIGRPNRHRTLEDAEQWLKTKGVSAPNATSFETPEELASKLSDEARAPDDLSPQTVNELTPRIKMSPENAMIAIFADNLESRLLAQYYQALAMKQWRLQTESDQQESEVLDSIPIIFYIPSSFKCFTNYSPTQQAQDRVEAYAVAHDPKKYRMVIEHNNYTFLLVLDPVLLKQLLLTSLDDSGSILNHMLYNGFIEFAEELTDRAGIDLRNFIQNDLSKSFAKPHPNFIMYLAKHYPEKYLTLPNDMVNSVVGKDSMTALKIAAKLGRVEDLVALLKNPNVEIDACDQHGWTALTYAAKFGQLNILRALIENKADTTILTEHPNFQGRVPIFFHALDSKQYEAVKILLTQDRDKFAYQKDQLLFQAIKERRTDLVKLFLDCGADPNYFDSFDEKNALICAIRNKDADMVRLLLEYHADVHARHSLEDPDESGSVLSVAEELGYDEIVVVLEQHMQQSDKPVIIRREESVPASVQDLKQQCVVGISGVYLTEEHLRELIGIIQTVANAVCDQQIKGLDFGNISHLEIEHQVASGLNTLFSLTGADQFSIATDPEGRKHLIIPACLYHSEVLSYADFITKCKDQAVRVVERTVNLTLHRDQILEIFDVLQAKIDFSDITDETPLQSWELSALFERNGADGLNFLFYNHYGNDCQNVPTFSVTKDSEGNVLLKIPIDLGLFTFEDLKRQSLAKASQVHLTPEHIQEMIGIIQPVATEVFMQRIKGLDFGNISHLEIEHQIASGLNTLFSLTGANQFGITMDSQGRKHLIIPPRFYDSEVLSYADFIAKCKNQAATLCLNTFSIFPDINKLGETKADNKPSDKVKITTPP